MLFFAWIIDLNAAISIFIRETYGFRYSKIGTFSSGLPYASYLFSGYFSFASIVVLLLGAIVSHALQIFAARIYAKLHQDRIDPEAHLLPVWVATPMMVVGIAMVGVSLQINTTTWLSPWCGRSTSLTSS
jgi:hypothetical protein